MMDPRNRRRDWWAPGLAPPPGVRGYTREEATAGSPGWAGLAGRAWDAVTVAGGRVLQVKEKFAALRVYWDGVAWDSPAGKRLQAQIAAIETESMSVCEACGRPGRVWADADEERADITRATGRRWHWWRTLCAHCGYNYYYGGARGWAEIRGEWRPEVDEDDEDLNGENW